MSKETAKATAKADSPKPASVADVLAEARKMNEHAATITDAKQRMEAVEAANRKMAEDIESIERALAKQNISLPGCSQKDTGKRFSIGNVMRCLLHKDNTDVRKEAGHEIEIIEQTFKRNEDEINRRRQLQKLPPIERAMSTLTGADGGFSIPEELMAEVFPAFYSNTVVAELGARFITPRGWPLKVNRVATKSTAYHVAEGVATTASAPKLAQLTLRPRTVSALNILTNDLVNYSDPSTDAWLADDMSRQVNVEVDRGCLVGDDTDNEPLGLVNQGVATDLTINAALTLVQLKKMKAKLMGTDSLVNGGKFGFAFHPLATALLEQERIAQYSGDTAGDYVFANVSDAGIEAVVGYPVRSTTSLPTNVGSGTQSWGIFGNWADFIVAKWGGVDIRRSFEATAGGVNLFETRSMAIMVSTMYDSGIVRGASFCTADDVNVS